VNLGGIITLTNDTQFAVDGGTTLNLTNAAGITGSANASSTNVTLAAASGGAGVITGPLNLGSGSLTKTGSGAWTIAPTNNYTGLTAINGGTLDITAATALGPVSTFTSNYVTLNGGTLGVTTNVAFLDGLGGFTIGSAGTFDVVAGATLVISNRISGSNTITKADSGTLVLSGSNTFNGTLHVDAGNASGDAGFVIIANPNAITNVISPIAIRNYAGGNSSFELDGGSGSITVKQDITMAGKSPARARHLKCRRNQHTCRQPHLRHRRRQLSPGIRQRLVDAGQFGHFRDLYHPRPANAHLPRKRVLFRGRRDLRLLRTGRHQRREGR